MKSEPHCHADENVLMDNPLVRSLSGGILSDPQQRSGISSHTIEMFAAVFTAMLRSLCMSLHAESQKECRGQHQGGVGSTRLCSVSATGSQPSTIAKEDA